MSCKRKYFSLSALSLNLCWRYQRYNYNKIILMETAFGSSYAAKVLEIRIPLYSASSEEKEKKTKTKPLKRNLFYQCITTKWRARVQRLPASFAFFFRTALIYWVISYLIGFLSACLACKCFYELAASRGLFHQLLACQTGRISFRLCMIAV